MMETRTGTLTLELIIKKPRESPEYPYNWRADNGVGERGIPSMHSVRDYLPDSSIEEIGTPYCAIKVRRIGISSGRQRLEVEAWFEGHPEKEYHRFNTDVSFVERPTKGDELYRKFETIAGIIKTELEKTARRQLYCVATRQDYVMVKDVFNAAGFSVRLHTLV